MVSLKKGKDVARGGGKGGSKGGRSSSSSSHGHKKASGSGGNAGSGDPYRKNGFKPSDDSKGGKDDGYKKKSSFANKKNKGGKKQDEEEEGYEEVPVGFGLDQLPSTSTSAPASAAHKRSKASASISSTGKQAPLGGGSRSKPSSSSFGFDFDSDDDGPSTTRRRGRTGVDGDDDDDDSDDDMIGGGGGMDLTSALAGGGSSKSKKSGKVADDDDGFLAQASRSRSAGKAAAMMGGIEDILGVRPAASSSSSSSKNDKASSAPSGKGKYGRARDDLTSDDDDESSAAEEPSDDEEIEALMGQKLQRDGNEAAKKAASGGGAGGKKAAGGGGGSWGTMGLSAPLLRSLLLRGYKTPTPIQRASVPHAIATPPRDLVGMARTGSGKTLAYVLPMLQRLGGKHSTKFGARAVVLCPGRELAMQILRVGKEMARGFKSVKSRGGGGRGDEDDDKDDGPDAFGHEPLRWGLVVGGESLDDQFAMIASNPDVIIATPGRLLHLIVEMNLDLRSVECVIFDEADRLFEMGFETQLHEILHRLPSTRQTLLFSATLPRSLVEFAKAGLVNPKLIRLDAESRISPDLRTAFFSVKPAEKEAALIGLLRDVIKVPVDPEAASKEDGPEASDAEDDDYDDDQRRRGPPKRRSERRPPMNAKLASHQAIVFTATKHHVEYLTTLLRTAGYTTSHIYGSLDQVARKRQMDRFRRGRTSLLVVTDVAARGIDIPVLENVINYDFPTGARIFVHRVGRTARAGRQGWAWSFVTSTELPYLLDLQLFLGKPLVTPKDAEKDDNGVDSTNQLVFGTIPRDSLDADTEYVATTLNEAAPHLRSLKEVVRKGQAMYERSQGKASQESYRRAKAMMKDEAWGLAGTANEYASAHPVFAASQGAASTEAQQAAAANGEFRSLAADPNVIKARAALLAKVNSFSPAETVFEVGSRGKTVGAQIMQDRRRELQMIKKKQVRSAAAAVEEAGSEPDQEEEDVEMAVGPAGDMELADEADLEAAFEVVKPKKSARDYKDEQFYMSYQQNGAAADRG